MRSASCSYCSASSLKPRQLARAARPSWKCSAGRSAAGQTPRCGCSLIHALLTKSPRIPLCRLDTTHTAFDHRSRCAQGAKHLQGGKPGLTVADCVSRQSIVAVFCALKGVNARVADHVNAPLYKPLRARLCNGSNPINCVMYPRHTVHGVSTQALCIRYMSLLPFASALERCSGIGAMSTHQRRTSSFAVTQSSRSPPTAALLQELERVSYDPTTTQVPCRL